MAAEIYNTIIISEIWIKFAGICNKSSEITMK
jgi:hypothetical protein